MPGPAVLGSILGRARLSAVELLPAGLSGKVIRSSRETLGEATVVAAHLGGAQGRSVLVAARTAYVDALCVTDLAAAGLLIVGAVLALTLLPATLRVPPADRLDHEPAAAGT